MNKSFIQPFIHPYVHTFMAFDFFQKLRLQQDIGVKGPIRAATFDFLAPDFNVTRTTSLFRGGTGEIVMMMLWLSMLLVPMMMVRSFCRGGVRSLTALDMKVSMTQILNVSHRRHGGLAAAHHDLEKKTINDT